MAFFSSMMGWRRTWTFVLMAGSSSMKRTPLFARKTPVPAKERGSLGLMPFAMAWMSFRPRSFASFVYSFPWIREKRSCAAYPFDAELGCRVRALPAPGAHALLRPFGVVVVGTALMRGTGPRSLLMDRARRVLPVPSSETR